MRECSEWPAQPFKVLVDPQISPVFKKMQTVVPEFGVRVA